MTTALSLSGAQTVLTAKQYSQLSEVIGCKDELVEGERVLAQCQFIPTPL